MGNYNTNSIAELLSTNTYPGRGIIIGKSADGKSAMIAYFIMGRSENSRNRIFERYEGGMRTKAFDESKLSDPSLIIYNPYLALENADIITNGDQTDTVYNYIKENGDDGYSFEKALTTLTPDRFSLVLNINLSRSDWDFLYIGVVMSITPNITAESKGMTIAKLTPASTSMVNAIIIAPNTTNGDRNSSLSVKFIPDCTLVASVVIRVMTVDAPSVSISLYERLWI
jgi:hypothetical protein